LEEAIRERVREVIEEILHEEVEEAWARGEASAPWDVAATGMEGSIAG
jgi:hypothetical protein